MRILAIETSCDETAIAILECTGEAGDATYRILGNSLISQIDIHRPYGGVFPAIAKREHARNLVPILANALGEAGLANDGTTKLDADDARELATLLAREPGLHDAFSAFLGTNGVPEIDAIAVTHGPGLTPALWVGINFAKALALAWNRPLVGVNHMEGHLLSALARETDDGALTIANVTLPVLALLISGGHTELDIMRDWLSYELLGATRDDAVGEAYDKVARMLDLPYPGGPEVSRLAEQNRTELSDNPYTLPRPMIREPHLDFSFSGLKTAVLYLVKDKELSLLQKAELARAFEDAAADVLFAKTSRALTETGAKTLVLGGGVSANTNIRRVFAKRLNEQHPEVALRIPSAALTTDNAVMIGIAGYLRVLMGEYSDPDTMIADGNLAIAP